MSKRRSGLANDRKAYRICCRSIPTPIPTPITPCPSIILADIATTNDGITWLLNHDTIILKCQILEIPAGQTLQINHNTLTNNGTINVRGLLRNTTKFSLLTSNSETINNGTINVFLTGSIACSNEYFGVGDAIFTNNGLININNGGYIFCQTFGVINNNSGGRINNNNGALFRINARGIFNNNSVFINNIGADIINNGDGSGIGGIINNNNGAYIINYATISNGLSSNFYGDINNNGTIINIGIINNAYFATITNNAGGTITNNAGGIIYNNQNGTITTVGIFTNNGIINNADGSSTCGIGILTGITTIYTTCPP